MHLGYLSSRYPAISHTFIRREVEAMRVRGFTVSTFSLRASEHLLAEEDQRERETTWVIVPQSSVRIVVDHAAAALKRPVAYMSTLQLALRHRLPGARAGLWALFHFAEAVLLARELERRRVEHLHVHFSNAGGTVGMLAARYLDLPWSITLHGSADFEAPTRMLIPAKIVSTRFTVCVSNFGRVLAMRDSDPGQWAKLSVIRCGVDLTRLPKRQRPPENARPRVLSVGRLSPEKGFVGLVEAFAEVCARGLDAELLILGEGPERARIEAAIARHGLAARCRLPGAAAPAQVEAEMRNADVFAMASFMEGLPVVLVEAMALGVPVVAPRVAGIPELIEHDHTGYLFTPGVWSELAAELSRLLAPGGQRASTIDAARRRIEAEFDVHVSAAKLARQLTEAQ